MCPANPENLELWLDRYPVRILGAIPHPVDRCPNSRERETVPSVILLPIFFFLPGFPSQSNQPWSIFPFAPCPWRTLGRRRGNLRMQQSSSSPQKWPSWGKCSRPDSTRPHCYLALLGWLTVPPFPFPLPDVTE